MGPRAGALALAAAALVACGEPAHVEAPMKARPAADPGPPGFESGAWGTFHSKRFQLSIPLPDGTAWKIDDHSRAELVATHAPTRSRLVVFASYEHELMNRAKCEARAHDLGLVPTAPLHEIEREATVGPAAYDSTVWVTTERRDASAAGDAGGLVGHVMLFGAFIRRCLFVHLETEVPRAEDEAVLSSRLAVARVKIVGRIEPDAPRTAQDTELPREGERGAAPRGQP